MSKDILRQLKNLKSGEVNPRADWVSKNRSLLLSQIGNTVNASDKPNFSARSVWDGLSIFFSPNTVNFAMRPIAILLIVSLVFLTSKIATVDAAYQALPGDLLYPAKRVVEKTQVAVAQVMGDQKSETKLHSEFAKRRASETQRLMKGDDPQKNAKVTQTLTDLKQELTSVNQTLSTTGAVTADVAQEVKQNTEDITDTLKQVKNNLVVDNTNTNLTQQVNSAKDAAKTTELNAVQTMVTQNLQGDNTVTKEEVKQEIANTLNNAVTDAASNKQNADDANKVVEAVKVEVKDLTKDPAAGVEMTSSTKDLSNKITVMAAETKDASAKANVIVKEMDKKVTEAKALLSTDDLSQALDKVKEATATSQKVEAITDQTIASVQKVLPVMSVVVKENATTALVTSTASNIVIMVSTTPALNNGIMSTTSALMAPVGIKPSVQVIIPTVTTTPIKLIKPAVVIPKIKILPKKK